MLVFLVLTSCTQENLDFESFTEPLSKSTVQKEKASLVSICHNNGNQITISSASLNAHLAHGDAVDMDGDGFYNIENGCSPVDCDDTTYSEDNTCGPVIWTTSSWDPGNEWEYGYIENYLFTRDNFETLNASANYGETSKACVLNASLLSRNGSISTYDGGADFGTITLTFQNSNYGRLNYTLTNDGPKKLQRFQYFYDAPLLSIDCLPFHNE